MEPKESSFTPAYGADANTRDDGTAVAAIGLASEAKEFKRDEAGSLLPDDIRELQLAASSISRTARDNFKAACESHDGVSADVALYSVKDALQELWRYAGVRSRAFHDLLGLLEAALRKRSLQDFDDTQRNVIRSAFADLGKLFIDPGDVDSHLRSFAMNGIDITGPIEVNEHTRRFKVVIEEI